MRKLFFAGAALIALIAAGPAMAADGAPRAYNWTGVYVGGHCGGAWGRTHTRPIDDDAEPDIAIKPSGGLCGGQLGVNGQMAGQPIVWGIEGDSGYLWLSGRDDAPSDDEDNRAIRAVKYRWYGTATGRLGYAWDRLLVYLKGGAAWARIKSTAFETEGGVVKPDDVAKVTNTKPGWTVGGGAEYGLTQNWSIKGEYLYMDFGHQTTSTTPGAGEPSDSFRHRNRVHTVKFGVNYRFFTWP